MSSRRCFENAARTVTLGGSDAKSKLPGVRLDSSFLRRPVRYETAYSRARSSPEYPWIGLEQPRAEAISLETSSAVSARRLCRTSTSVFSLVSEATGLWGSRLLATSHLPNSSIAWT